MGNYYHQHRGDYQVEGGIVCVDKKMAIPAVLPDGCVDVYHATHPGQLGMNLPSVRT